MKFSVVVCSWNRAAMLEETIQSVLACDTGDALTLDIIVVDNASTDDTQQRMRSYAAAGDIRLFYEAIPGLSNARNCGMRYASGDWIFFLDDDVLLPPDFFLHYQQAFLAFPALKFWGGPVVPLFEDKVANWVPAVIRKHPWCFSALDLGPPTRDLSDKQLPFGANMCVHGSLRHHFQFRSGLGYSHGSLVPGEETDFFSAVKNAGHCGGWNANAPLLHRLPAARADFRYLARRAKGQGTADALATQNAGHRSRWVIRELGVVAGRITASVFKGADVLVPLVLDALRHVSHLRTAYGPKLRSPT